MSTTLLHTRLGGADPIHRAIMLRRTVAAETAVLTVVLAVTSALVATTPATASLTTGQERTAHAGPITIDITATNPQPHMLDVHLYAYGSDGTLAEVERMTAQARPQNPSAGLGPVSIPLLQAGTGHFLAGRLLLPNTGDWTFTIVVQTGTFDAYTTSTTLTVR